MGAKEYPLTFTLGIVDNGSGQFSIAARKIRVQAGALESDLTKRFENSSKALSSFGRKASFALTAPIVGAGIYAGKVAMDFEDSMANIGTIIDTNTESLDKMGATVIDIGKRTPVALSDLSGSLYDVRSAGISANDQFKVLEGSARLAVAGLGSTKEATDLVTSAINAFGLTGEKQDRVYNNLFSTIQFGKTTVSGLAQGFGGVAATIASSGTELDEYLSMVAALTTTGQPASQAHTQLKAVISGLTRESKETSAVFRTLGVKNLPELIQKYGGLMPAMRAVADVAGGTSKVFQKLGAKDFQDLVKKSGGVEQAFQKIEKSGDKDAAALLKLVGSTEALNAILSLTGSTAEAQTTALDKMRNSSDALNDAFAKKSDTSAAAAKRLRNEIDAIGISVGNSLLPALGSVASVAGDAASAFGGLSDSGRQTVIWSGVVLGAVGPVVTAFEKAATAARFLAAIPGGAGLVVGGAVAATFANTGSDLGHWGADELGKPNAGERLHDAQIAADKAKIEASLFAGGMVPPGAERPIEWTPKAPAAFSPGSPANQNQNTETTAKIKIDLSGLPPGARVSSESSGPTPVDVDTGRAMGT